MLANKLFFVAVCAFGAEYRPAAAGATLDSFVLTVDGPRVSFAAQKRGGGSFAVHWVRGSRYLLQEGGGPVREFRHPVTGAAVLPSIGGWDAVMPTGEAETLTVFGARVPAGWIARRGASSGRGNGVFAD